MAAEPLQQDRDLVALYAKRLSCRGTLGAAGLASPRRQPAVHQFGRRPRAQRRRSRAQRAGAVSALVATAFLVGTQAVGAATHDVQPGETLGGIAERYATTVEALAELNGLDDPNHIVAGMTLTIAPDADPATPVQPVGQAYEVKPGDTVGEIASNFGVTVEAIVQANDIADPDLIEVGQALVIPAPAPAATRPAVAPATAGSVPLHLVMPGESLSLLAERYGVTVGALVSANAIADPNVIEAGSLLRIPGAASVTDGVVRLRGMPALRQSLPLSSELAAASIATAYWGNQISEWVFIENLSYHPDPHLGFRGSVTGPFGGTDDYGIYAEPLVPLLNRYGFQAEVFYADGDAELLKAQIDRGRPVIAWMTNLGSTQQRFYEWHQGQRFALVPQEHAVVVYGYDADGVHVVDPGDGSYRTFDWATFLRSWGYFDGMSLAVYPS